MGRSRWAAVAAIVTVAAVAAVVLSTSRSDAPNTSSSVAVIQRHLERRLEARHLSVLGIACVHNGRRYDGVRVVRCNVNFGDPHIVAYCSVLRRGALLTSVDDPSIPCRHDDVGWSAPIETFG